MHTNKITWPLIADIVAISIFCWGMVKNGFDSFSVGIVYLMLIAIGILLVLKHKISRRLTIKELIPFSIVIILELPLQKLCGQSYYGWASAFNGVIIFLLMAVTIFLILDDNNEYVLWKVVNIVAVLSSLLIIIQEIAYLAGIRLDQVSEFGTTFFNAWKYQFFRPCGPFSEPSHFAELGLLSLYYYLFLSFNKIKVMIIGLALIVSTSSLGIVGVILLGILYVLNFSFMRGIKKWKKILIVFVAVVAGVFLLWWIENTSNIVVIRMISGGSSSVRVNRSFELFSVLSGGHKLLGIGIQNQQLFLNSFGIVLPSDNYETISSNREFAQTFGYILCTTGLVGMFSFWGPIIKAATQSDYRLKVNLILFGFVCVTCCIFSRATFLVYLMMFFATRNIMKKEAARSEQE